MTQTSSVPPVTTLSFRHDTDPELLADPFDTWDRLREKHGTFLSDQAEAHGVVTLAPAPQRTQDQHTDEDRDDSGSRDGLQDTHRDHYSSDQVPSPLLGR